MDLVITWAAENRIDLNFDKFEPIKFQKTNKRYFLSDLLFIDGEEIVLKDKVFVARPW